MRRGPLQGFGPLYSAELTCRVLGVAVSGLGLGSRLLQCQALVGSRVYETLKKAEGHGTRHH